MDTRRYRVNGDNLSGEQKIEKLEDEDGYKHLRGLKVDVENTRKQRNWIIKNISGGSESCYDQF